VKTGDKPAAVHFAILIYPGSFFHLLDSIKNLVKRSETHAIYGLNQSVQAKNHPEASQEEAASRWPLFLAV
jgi:hypothetical protein